jgi:tRNA (guanine37-N1)-methyltransferase
MRFDVISLFPQLFDEHLKTSLLGKAVTGGVVDVGVHDLRPFGLGKHQSVDDEPFGGGAGMVLRPEPIFDAVESVRIDGSHVVLLSARGRRFDHQTARSLAERNHVILVCGRYEGVDERIAEVLCDEELSIGDYVLAGGELAALVVIEATTRLVPGVLGNEESPVQESFAHGLLEYPQYTRPASWRGHPVPDVLLSGDHAAIERWRADQAERVTRDRRPDLLG